jgi:hypothetical protein
VIQPLAPRRVNNPGEYVTYGFYRWMSTWSVDIVSTGNVFWKDGDGGALRLAICLLARTTRPSSVRTTTELLAEYNVGKTIPPALDAKFGALASAEGACASDAVPGMGASAAGRGHAGFVRALRRWGLDAAWWNVCDEHHACSQIEAVGLGAC